MKSKAKVGALLSLLFMGLGQLYHRQFAKGIFLLLLEAYVLIFWSLPFQWAMWGLTTLGETPQIRKAGRIVYPGDHSIFLMIEGIIYLIAFLLFIWIYYLNIRDAYKTGKIRDEGGVPNNIKQTLRNIWENGFPYVMLTPAVLFTAFLTILPLIFGIAIAFTNYSGPNYLPPKNLVDWVGFKSFVDLFQLKTWSRTFYGVFIWTFIWAIISTISIYFVGMLFASLLGHRKIRFKRFWRAIFILPWAVPGFISTLIMRNIFNGEFGPLNKYLQVIGFDPIPWFSDPFWAKMTLFMVNLWLGFPFWMLLMSGVMTSIDKELYEAAEVDGATAWQKFWKIMFPIVVFSTTPLLIMGFAGNFNNFGLIYFLTSGGPVNPDYTYAGSTDILITWLYKLTLEQNKFNIASVVSILIFIVVAALSIYNFRRTRAFREEDMMSQ
ncbi:sugar ABC transporter permease [Microaerobacter geothermalis]|uniref:carbohydrate ABC transporter permease n=1 Tax=Microaerobacter geothermalis TaxID=674972 RepID=UPI001F316DAF|nr:sugar ABC transporter permease [Microaerobacter geothermalis]MCF6094271.1 sugar ABC transporter permease [Microaerobacter geothermalis]